MADDDLLSVAEVNELTGLTVQTLKKYRQRRLLNAVGTRSTGHAGRPAVVYLRKDVEDFIASRTLTSEQLRERTRSINIGFTKYTITREPLQQIGSNNWYMSVRQEVLNRDFFVNLGQLEGFELATKLRFLKVGFVVWIEPITLQGGIMGARTIAPDLDGMVQYLLNANSPGR